MLSDVPNKRGIAAVANVKFDSRFVFKRMANSWSAGLYVTGGWLGFMILFGYLFRSAEITACLLQHTLHTDCMKPNATTWVTYGKVLFKTNDFFLWNAIWFVFVTMTTVGYVDQLLETPRLGGKLVCAFSTIVGVALAILITAAFSNLNLYSPQVQAAISGERERHTPKYT